MKCLKKIRKTFKDREIGYEDFGGYELITEDQELDFNTMRSNIDYLNHSLKKIVKKEKSFYLSDERIAEFGFANLQHLIENRLEGQLHSGKLCEALLKLVVSMGVTILNSIEIKSFEKIN